MRGGKNRALTTRRPLRTRAVLTADAGVAQLQRGHDPHALIVLDADARVASWLFDAPRTFGYTQQEMLGQNIDRIYVPEDLARGEIEWELRAARAYGSADSERWHLCKDGRRIWTTSVMTALKGENGQLIGFAKLLRDRGELPDRHGPSSVRFIPVPTMEVDKHLLLGTLAHELRNPLGPLTNAAHMIRMVAADQPQVAACVQIIERQVRFIDNLVRDLLEATRVGVGKVRLHYESVDLRKVVDSAIETCSAALDDRRQSVSVAIADAMKIDADTVRLQQVLVNLIMNSAKFSPLGSVIRINAAIDGDDLTLKVEDSGSGIPPELLPKIFDLFTQSGHGEAAGQGLGLGLGLVKAIVQMHQGTVEARSDGNGHGTTITVRMPRRRPIDGGRYSSVGEA